jgi:hypothetical protein
LGDDRGKAKGAEREVEGYPTEIPTSAENISDRHFFLARACNFLKVELSRHCENEAGVPASPWPTVNRLRSQMAYLKVLNMRLQSLRRSRIPFSA